MQSREVFICGAARTPHGKFMGALKDFSTAKLGGLAIKSLLRTHRLRPYDADGVFMGEVLTAGEGQNPARHAALAAGLPISCHAETFNKVCSSSLAALRHATHMIRLGEAECMIAGGMENMSRAPYLVRKRGKHVGDGKLCDFIKEDQVRVEVDVHDSMSYDGLTEPTSPSRAHMGVLADMCARDYNISREAQEQYSFESCTRALEERHIPYVTRVTTETGILERDEGLREPNMEKMRQMKPAFSEWGSVTAATSSQIADGASAVLITDGYAARALSLEPFAVIRKFAVYSQDPNWYTTAPIGAIKKLGIKVSEVDLFEVNEAFAVVPLVTMRELSIPREKMNVWGGAIAIGHPIGASGTRIVGTLAIQMRVLEKRYGIAVTCNGGGEAVAVLLERV